MYVSSEIDSQELLRRVWARYGVFQEAETEVRISDASAAGSVERRLALSRMFP